MPFTVSLDAGLRPFKLRNRSRIPQIVDAIAGVTGREAGREIAAFWARNGGYFPRQAT